MNASRVVELIRREGAITFDRFMEAALYGEGGFFASGRGARRDFVTSPEVGSLFGMCVARALDGYWRALGEPDPFLVIEAGAGNGRLARDVWRADPACVARAAVRARRALGRIASRAARSAPARSARRSAGAVRVARRRGRTRRVVPCRTRLRRARRASRGPCVAGSRRRQRAARQPAVRHRRMGRHPLAGGARGRRRRAAHGSRGAAAGEGRAETRGIARRTRPDSRVASGSGSKAAIRRSSTARCSSSTT